MDFAESFGQRVDLCGRLREILGSYPEGTSILRELIQNAVRGCAQWRWRRGRRSVVYRMMMILFRA
jgi:hypothetical protein